MTAVEPSGVAVAVPPVIPALRRCPAGTVARYKWLPPEAQSSAEGKCGRMECHATHATLHLILIAVCKG